MWFLQVVQEVLSTPAILIGVVAMLGLILQKKAVEDIIKGTIKTIVGFLVLIAGSSFLQEGSLNDFGTIFNYAFNVKGVVPNNEAIVTVGLENYAQPTALIMCLGMIANIAMARYSRWKYIFLSGHHTLYMACLIAIVLSESGLKDAPLVIAGALILGLVMALFPAMAQKTVTKITGTDEIGFGHFSTIGYWFAAQVGKLVSAGDRKKGKEIKSTEDIRFPKRLSFMRDNTVAISIAMMILFVIVTAVAASKPEFAKLDTNYSADKYKSWITYALVSGMNFAGGIYIILSGVRMILAEIVPAFKGIADKLVPNAKPAIDCPVVFPYAPNAVFIGFLASFLGGIVGMFLLFGISGIIPSIAIILPGVVPHFFCGATSGVFANAEGGLKGCIIGSFLHGLLITFLPLVTMPVLGGLQFEATTFSDTDFCGTAIVLGTIGRVVTGNLLLVACVIIFLLPIVYNYAAPKKVSRKM